MCFVESRRCFCPISFWHNLDIVLHLNIYITEVKKQQSSRGKKKRYAGLRVDYDRCKLISETSPLSSASQKKHRAAEWNAQPVGGS